MSEDKQGVVIIGAGHGGGNAVAALRQFGHEGPITLIGDEPHLPYHRPPLSKAYLKGEAELSSLDIRAEDFYTQQKVTLHLGQRVTEIDREAKCVRLEPGVSVPYDVLILATGARARELPIPGIDAKNVHALRNIADADRMRAEIGKGRRVAVIGGGYIGLEVAASVTGLASSAVVIEREERLLARVASEPLANFFAELHGGHGVEIITGAQVESLDVSDDHVRSVRLTGGRSIDCDAVVVGVGAQTCDELGRAAGLQCENGIVVDIDARTSDPSIFAIGDVAWRPMPLYGDRMFRLESVPNATEQARQAAAAIAGKPRPAPEVPWFWSDQFDVKLQIAGLPFDVDELVVRNYPGENKLAVFHLSDGHLACVEAASSPKDYMGGKKLIAEGVAVDKEKLADPDVPAKDAALT